jgi:hypothetical protein
MYTGLDFSGINILKPIYYWEEYQKHEVLLGRAVANCYRREQAVWFPFEQSMQQSVTDVLLRKGRGPRGNIVKQKMEKHGDNIL